MPYSPHLNPIEEFFACIKSKFHTVTISDAKIGVRRAIEIVLNQDNNYMDQITGFYQHMRTWLDKARRKEPLSNKIIDITFSCFS